MDLERFVSHMGIVKNEWRSLLKEDTLEALLCIKVTGRPIKDWNNTHFDEAITLWYNSKPRRMGCKATKFQLKSLMMNRLLIRIADPL